MSRVRNIYRRYARKPGTTNQPAQTKQQAPAFFEFGGERSFFVGKSPETAGAEKDEVCNTEDKSHKKENGVPDNVVSMLNDQQHDKIEPCDKELPAQQSAHVVQKDASAMHTEPEEIKEQKSVAAATVELPDKGKETANAKNDTMPHPEPVQPNLVARETDHADR